MTDILSIYRAYVLLRLTMIDAAAASAREIERLGTLLRGALRMAPGSCVCHECLIKHCREQLAKESK